MMTVLWYVRKQSACLINGDEVLVNGQDNANIDLWNTTGQIGEVVRDATPHFLGAFDVKTQIALAAIAEFLLEMRPTVPTVGMRPDMEHTCTGDVIETGNHLVERIATIRLAGKHMCATGWSNDVFSVEEPPLGADAVDFPIDDGVDPVVIARQNCVPFFFFVWKSHDFSLVLLKGLKNKKC